MHWKLQSAQKPWFLLYVKAAMRGRRKATSPSQWHLHNQHNSVMSFQSALFWRQMAGDKINMRQQSKHKSKIWWELHFPFDFSQRNVISKKVSKMFTFTRKKEVWGDLLCVLASLPKMPQYNVFKSHRHVNSLGLGPTSVKQRTMQCSLSATLSPTSVPLSDSTHGPYISFNSSPRLRRNFSGSVAMKRKIGKMFCSLSS